VQKSSIYQRTFIEGNALSRSNNAYVELEPAAHEACLFASLKQLSPLVSGVCWFSNSATEVFSKQFDTEAAPVLLLSLVSRRSIMRDTVAIPTFTSLLTSEPRSAIEVLRENNLSLHPFVPFEMDSLYLEKKETQK
jgi:hypothetical protein